MKVISIGEVLWDVIGGKEHLGGAPFNFAAHLQRLGDEVIFVSSVGEDDRGHRILEKMPKLGLSTKYVHSDKCHQTGVVTVSLASGGQPAFVIHRPAAYDYPVISPEEFDELLADPVDWIYFGTLLQMSSAAKELVRELLAALPTSRRFYDVNLRTASYTPELVKELLDIATVVKLNDAEVEEISKLLGAPSSSLEKFCREYAAQFSLEAVCVTRGAKGCSLLLGQDFVEHPGYKVRVADTVGAGDAFAAALLHGIGAGWAAASIADFSNRVGALVASRAGAVPRWTLEEVAGMGGSQSRLETA